MAAALRSRIGLVHWRIVLMVRRERRLPEPARPERAVLEELTAHGVLVGAFNPPDWEETRAGFHELLRSLFQITPPTALIIDDAPLFAAVRQFLATHGIRVPQQISLVGTDADPTFEWCQPTIANIDENMGRLDEFLAKNGLKADTIVLYLSDNGSRSQPAAQIWNGRMRGH